MQFKCNNTNNCEHRDLVCGPGLGVLTVLLAVMPIRHSPGMDGRYAYCDEAQNHRGY